MSFIGILLLALVQGICEFLPVSSSGHLLLAQELLGIDSGSGPELELFLHLGTLLTILIFYRVKIRSLCFGLLSGSKASWHYAIALLLGCLPAGLLYLAFSSRLESLFDSALLAAIMLLFTGLLLVSSRFLRRETPASGLSWPQALLVGLAQCLALIPGVSRSGTTIVAARALRCPLPLAVEFSFLMNVPLLLGALLFKHKELLALADSGKKAGLMLIACAIAAATGFLSLKILYKSIAAKRFWQFGPYCIVAGMLATALLLMKLHGAT